MTLPISFQHISILLGKMHPVVVHFPITLAIFAGYLELLHWWRGRREHGNASFGPSESGVTATWIGAISAVVAAGMGWINAWNEDYRGELEEILFYHRWGGTTVAVLMVLSLVLALSARRGSVDAPRRWSLSLYRALLFVSVILIGISAHFGGLMVYGPDYYDEVFDPKATSAERASSQSEREREQPRGRLASSSTPDGGQAPTDAATLVSEGINVKGKPIDFLKEVRPIFEENCAKCHSNGKRKGGYNLDSRADAIHGGETREAIVPGKSSESYLIDLVSGKYPKKIMPNKGRTLNQNEIATLRRWIDQGAPWGGKEVKLPRVAKVGTAPRLPELPPASMVKGKVALGAEANPIDRILAPYFAQHQISEGPLVDDRTFARRVSFDLVGRAPNPQELKKFIASSDPHKRRKLITSMLSDSRGYATHWMSFWNDALRNDYSGPGFLHGGRREITEWLYSSLYTNKPFDKFVRELVNPGREAAGFIGGVRWWRSGVVNANEEIPMQAAQNVAQVFMGINLKCSSCHNSFTDEWTLHESYGLANTFAGRPLETHNCNVPIGIQEPAHFLYPELGDIVGRHRRERLRSLAQILTSDKNGRFARTIVNRVWARFFGRGIVEPIDEMDNIPWNADLLDWLASDFVANRYDLHTLFERVMTSRAYQMQSVGAKERYSAGFVFAGPLVRRISVEQGFDTLVNATGAAPVALPSDVKRVLAVQETNPRLPETRTEGQLIRGHSGDLSVQSSEEKLSVDISGAASVWLIAIRRNQVESALDRQRKQFATVDKQDRGLAPLSAESSQSTRDQTSQRLQGRRADGKKSKKKKSEGYAVWRSPTIVTRQGRRPVLSVSPEPAVFVDADVVQGMSPIDSGLLDLSASPTASHQFELRDADIKTGVFSAIRFDVRGLSARRLEASVKVESQNEEDPLRVEFVVATDLEVRAAFLEATETLLALGRPRREQILTSRSSAATTMQALEMANGKGLRDLLVQAAKGVIRAQYPSTDTLVRTQYLSLLSREPTPTELKLVRGRLGAKPQAEDIEDFLWSLVVHPEFQLVS